ncbi:flagellar assembly protein FliH [Clostridiaceae bacterium UIB06]|nr:flagellar assembly protein FliH [Clostridiaceae bacterium UIB06]
MQSLCNVIKNSSVIRDGNRQIVTEFEAIKEVQEKEVQVEQKENNIRSIMDSYENIARTMIEDARRKREEILSAAFQEADRISKEAYEKAYQEGGQNGYNDGFNKAYEEGYKTNLDKALQEGESIKANADNVLKSAIEEKERYLKEKENQIKDLIINCVENILRKEVKEKDGLNNIIFEALSKVKNTNTFIIKSNSVHCEEFKSKTELWKEQLPFKGDIFIIPDESMEPGNAIIERENGKIEVGADIAMEKVREVFNSVE